MKRNRIQRIASLIGALQNCQKTGNAWAATHRERLDVIARDCLPSGSGFDSGTKIDIENSKPDRVVFLTSFHHMNDAGMYDGWSDHSVIATPSLIHGFELRVTGRDRRDIKDYIAENFQTCLSADDESREWSGTPDANDPDNFWIDDATGERVNATTGERSKP